MLEKVDKAIRTLMPVLPASAATLLLTTDAEISLLLVPAVILPNFNILKQDFLFVA